jgi:hypothetical protein
MLKDLKVTRFVTLSQVLILKVVTDSSSGKNTSSWGSKDGRIVDTLSGALVDILPDPLLFVK